MKTASNPLALSDIADGPVLGPPRRAARPLTVLLAGRLTALAGADGSESQMLALARTLPTVGVHARPWRPWEEPLAGADCLHLFGAAPEHLAVAEAARRQNVKVVLSPLAWQDEADRLQPPRTLARRAAAWAGNVSRCVCPWRPSWQRRLYRLVDLFVPSSNAEAQRLMRQARVPAERIHIVHRGADPCFAQADPEPFRRRFGTREFVLYAGAIEPRNNQLGFLWAMQDVDRPVAMLGNAAPGCEWYMAECRRVAGSRVRFLPSLGHDDPLLASAYTACGCLVLPGRLETSGLAALEAGMSGTPLVLVEGGCASEYFGHQAKYVRTNDVPGIRRAVLTALAHGRSDRLARHVRTYFSWNAAAKAMREAYRKVL